MPIHVLKPDGSCSCGRPSDKVRAEMLAAARTAGEAWLDVAAGGGDHALSVAASASARALDTATHLSCPKCGRVGGLYLGDDELCVACAVIVARGPRVMHRVMLYREEEWTPDGRMIRDSGLFVAKVLPLPVYDTRSHVAEDWAGARIVRVGRWGDDHREVWADVEANVVLDGWRAEVQLVGGPVTMGSHRTGWLRRKTEGLVISGKIAGAALSRPESPGAILDWGVLHVREA